MTSAAYLSWDVSGLTGSVVAEKWRLEHCLVAGEGIAVYSGVQIESGRPVTVELAAAIPMPQLKPLRRPELLGRISHPSILEVLEVGATFEGLRYAVMEHAEGEPLSMLLARHGQLAPKQAAQIAVSLASALQGIHATGGVHGQLHAARIFVADQGRVKLSLGLRQPQAVDLTGDGTAQLIISRHPDVDWADVTQAVITPLPYCAPEQLLGHPLDAQMDIYSLGALLYEMLRGLPPHAGMTFAGAAAARLAFPPSPLAADVPAGLRKEAERALAKSPSLRHASAHAFAVSIEESLSSLRAATDVGVTGAQRLGDWRLVERIRATSAGTHWHTADGFLLVELASETSDVRASAAILAAEAFAGISHPRIARLVDSMSAGEIRYVVLDAAKGVTLRELEERLPVSTDVLARIALDALEAIECAHTQGAVFGDLTADGILVTKRGEVVLLPTCSRGHAVGEEDDIVAVGKLAKIQVPPHSAQLLAKRLRSMGGVADRELVGRLVSLADPSQPSGPPRVVGPLPPVPTLPPRGSAAPRRWSSKPPLPPVPVKRSAPKARVPIAAELPELRDTERPVVADSDAVTVRRDMRSRHAPVMAVASLCVACALVGVFWHGSSTVLPSKAAAPERTAEPPTRLGKPMAAALPQAAAREVHAISAKPAANAAKQGQAAAPARTSVPPERSMRARPDNAPSHPDRTRRADDEAAAPAAHNPASEYRPTEL